MTEDVSGSEKHICRKPGTFYLLFSRWTVESRLRFYFQGLYFSHFFCDLLVGVTTNSKASLGGVVNSSVASCYCSSPEVTSATCVSSHIHSLTSTRVGIYSCEKQMSQNQRPEDCVLAPQVYSAQPATYTVCFQYKPVML